MKFWEDYGPIVKDGFTFEPNGYTEIVNSGDGDYLTADTIWDFKVSKSKCPTPLDAVTICVATPIYFRGRTFLKIEMGGKAILGLSCLDYPSANQANQ